MPSRAELLAAGEHTLARAVEHAGGFLAVAQVCCAAQRVLSYCCIGTLS